MPNEIQQISPVLTVIADGDEYVIQVSKAVGKRLGAIILGQIPDATRVTFMDESGVKVFRNSSPKKVSGIPGKATQPAYKDEPDTEDLPGSSESPEVIDSPDIPEPSHPSHSLPPASQRIFQDSSAPPAPELVEEEYQAVLRQEEIDARELARQEQLNRQNPVPKELQNAEPTEPPAPRKREPRELVTDNSVCGRCEGTGQITNEAGFSGACMVCKGKGTVKAWGRGRRSPSSGTDSLHANAR